MCIFLLDFYQMKIVCGDLDSLSSAICTIMQLLSLYKEKTSVVVPTLLVSGSHKPNFFMYQFYGGKKLCFKVNYEFNLCLNDKRALKGKVLFFFCFFLTF